MIGYALGFASACFTLGLLANLWRLMRGPTPPDRILALDTMEMNMIGLTVAYGIWQNTGLNFEAALLFAMTGFISTVAYAKFLLRGDIIE